MNNRILDERYQLEKKIGTGGMADVYQARDLLLDRLVAIKILHTAFAEDSEFIAKFRREAQSAGKLSHPNIVGIYDVGCCEGSHYIVMEYVQGKTLKEYIKEHPHIPIDMAVKITIEIGNALAEAHDNGIIHCDIKPQNILLTPNHKVKVTDFGIARAVNSSTIMTREAVLGSVHYLSPEQAAGDKLNAKTDIYSLGIVLYEMLTNHLPFDGETAVSIALKHMQEEIPRPTRYNPAISPMLEECLLTALQRNPTRRYDNIQDFISELKIAQGFTTSSAFKAVERDFGTISKTVTSKTRRIEKCDTESKFSRFISNLPQKYILASMVLLFIVAFAWAFFSFGNFWSNKEVEVPNVVGKPVEVAEQILRKKELKVSIDEIASNDVPIGEVISQTPSANSKVKEQRIIHLTVSKGGTVILVPDLKGLTIEQAKERLTKLHLTLGNVQEGNDSTQPENIILTQMPLPSSRVDADTLINIVINTKQIKVPNVVGLPIEEAKKVLTDSKLTVGQITVSEGVSLTDPKALVTSQDPIANNHSNGILNLVIGKDKKQLSNIKKGTVNITLPKTGESKKLEIYVTDDTGKHQVYNEATVPGSNIVKDVSGVGSVRVQVVVDGSVIQDREL